MSIDAGFTLRSRRVLVNHMPDLFGRGGSSPSKKGSRNRGGSSNGGSNDEGLKHEAMDVLKDISEEEFRRAKELPDMPELKRVPAEYKTTVLRNMMRLCCVKFDFMKEERGTCKNKKREILLRLVEFVNMPAASRQLAFTKEFLFDIAHMFSENLFRPLPPCVDNYDPDEDDPILDAAWPHLQVVYELLLRFIVHSDVDAKIAKGPKIIDRSFCSQLICLFRTEDPRERDYLKTILHRIYGKFMSHRSFIRQEIGNFYHHAIVANRTPTGVAELLEILGSIINGFAVPLKSEHVKYLNMNLIPLHSTAGLAIYHPQLTYCVVQYVEKQTELADDVLAGLLRYWPWRDGSKQILFLNELEEILELTQPSALSEATLTKVYNLLRVCINSDHFQIAERSLFFFNNEHLVNLGVLSDTYVDAWVPILPPRPRALPESSLEPHRKRTLRQGALCTTAALER